MDLDDLPEFARMLNKLATVFPRDLSAMLIDAYFESLQGYSVYRIGHGMRWLCENRIERFFPTPGEIKESIDGHAPTDPALRLTEPEHEELSTDDFLKNRLLMRFVAAGIMRPATYPMTITAFTYFCRLRHVQKELGGPTEEQIEKFLADTGPTSIQHFFRDRTKDGANSQGNTDAQVDPVG